jgi:hypothetical protein
MVYLILNLLEGQSQSQKLKQKLKQTVKQTVKQKVTKKIKFIPYLIRKIIHKLNIDNHIMNFSAILDISSFFIGMIINLLLIALICYYFKRKYENLEIAQNEQAKVLYQLLQQNSSPKVMNLNDILNDSDKRSSLSDLDSDSESDDSDSDDEEIRESVKESIKESETTADKIKTINLINLDKNEMEVEEIEVQKVKVEIEESKELVIDELEELSDNTDFVIDKSNITTLDIPFLIIQFYI